jgi:hypothetical protein
LLFHRYYIEDVIEGPITNTIYLSIISLREKQNIKLIKRTDEKELDICICIEFLSIFQIKVFILVVKYGKQQHDLNTTKRIKGEPKKLVIGHY